MDQIPKPLLVVFAFLAAVGVILMAQPQYSACDAQIEIFQKKLQTQIYSRPGKKITLPPLIDEHLSQCKKGNDAGGCFALFQTLRYMLQEMKAFPESCAVALGEIGPVRKSLTQSLSLMALMAWGQTPPESPEKRFGWLGKPDLALFCDLRGTFEDLYGKEALEAFWKQELAQFPGEGPEFQDGVCTNCESRPTALQEMPEREAWSRSLYSTACTSFR